VAIGVVAIVIGLLLPSLSTARQTARRTAFAATIRQDAILVSAYCNDARGVFPIAATLAPDAAWNWGSAMLAGGHISDLRDLDPDGARRYGRNRVQLSKCMLLPAELMRPGFTVPPDMQYATPIRDDQVTYPSQKGLLIPLCSEPLPGDDPAGRCFFYTRRVAEPIAFADQSVAVLTRFDLIDGEAPSEIDGVGLPVYASWGGHRARDR
jgi:hypothetical protein